MNEAPPLAPTRIFDPSRRQFLVGSALIATATAAAELSPRTAPEGLKQGGLELVIPHQIGPWRYVSAEGLVLPPPDEDQVKTYGQLLTRTYADGKGSPIMLLIAYGSSRPGVFEVHRPESCYPAQGFKLSGREKLDVAVGTGASVPAIFWSAASDVRNEQLLYWTRIGAAFPDTWTAAHWVVVKNNLARRPTDGALVRMSVASNDSSGAIRQLERFARMLVTSVGNAGREVLLGSN